MIRRIGLIAMLLVLSPVLLVVRAAGSGEGRLDVQLINGTAGGGSVSGLDVTLTTYAGETESGTMSGKADSEGKAVFDGLATAVQDSYRVTVMYEGAEYESDLLQFSDNETTASATVTVFEATDSDSAISISAAHAIVYLDESDLNVVEYLVFTNSSDRTYTGSGDVTATGGRRTLLLPLPAGATRLEFGGDVIPENLLPDSAGLVDTSPVYPGDSLMAYSYLVPYAAGAYQFSQQYDYAVSTYNFLIEGQTTKATSSVLSPGEVVDFQGVKFVSLSGSDIPAGQVVDVQMSGLAAPGSAQGSNQKTLLTAMAILAVVVLAAAAFVYAMKRRNAEPVPVVDGEVATREDLLKQIASLDDEFEGGQIEEAAYRRLREELKSKVVGLMQGAKEESGKG